MEVIDVAHIALRKRLEQLKRKQATAVAVEVTAVYRAAVAAQLARAARQRWVSRFTLSIFPSETCTGTSCYYILYSTYIIGMIVFFFCNLLQYYRWNKSNLIRGDCKAFFYLQ